MVGRNDRVLIWDWFLILVCSVLTLEQLSLFLPIKDIVFLLVGCIVIVFSARKGLRLNRSFIWLAIYAILLFINYFSGDSYFSNIGRVVQEIAVLFFTAMLFVYIVTKDHRKLSFYLIIIILAIIVYYSVFTYLIDLQNPGIVRQTVALANEGNEELTFLYSRGLVNYSLPHAIPILIPAIIMNLKKKESNKTTKVLLFVSLIAALVIVYLSYSAMALILSIVTLVLSLIIRKGSLQDNIIRLVIVSILALPVIINIDILLNPLVLLFSSSEQTTYFDRLLDIQNLTRTGSTTGDIDSRMNMYEITVSALNGNLLFGTNDPLGGHSAIIDRLASLGLVGWIPYICFIIYQIKYTIKRIDGYSLSYYVIGFLAGITMLLTKNMSNWEMWFVMLTLMPLMLWLPNQKKSNTV